MMDGKSTVYFTYQPQTEVFFSSITTSQLKLVESLGQTIRQRIRSDSGLWADIRAPSVGTR
jgi:hypothetical protein